MAVVQPVVLSTENQSTDLNQRKLPTDFTISRSATQTLEEGY